MERYAVLGAVKNIKETFCCYCTLQLQNQYGEFVEVCNSTTHFLVTEQIKRSLYYSEIMEILKQMNYEEKILI